MEDLVTGVITNLKIKSDYTFYGDPSDDPNRFILHFTDPNNITTGSDQQNAGSIHCYYHNNQLYILGLEQSELGKYIEIYDINGQFIKHERINNYPDMRLTLNLS